jgi:hypothetical protein
MSKGKFDLLKETMEADFREVLSGDAGRRLFGSIFFNCGGWDKGLTSDAYFMAYMNGRRAAALDLLNTVRGIDPMLVSACDAAYRNAARDYLNDDGEDVNGDSDF